MRILITGSSGFIGSHLCNQLYADGHEIVALGSEGENKPLCKFFIKEQLHKINWGEKIFDDIDVVFHQSANNNTLDNDEANMMSANYYEPIRMFNELKLKNCKRVLPLVDAPYPHIFLPLDFSSLIKETVLDFKSKILS